MFLQPAAAAPTLAPGPAPAWRLRGPGVALSAGIALLAVGLAELPWMVANGLSALTLAIVIGMVVGNTAYPAWAPRGDAGVGYAKQQILRAGIVLYGLRLTLQDIGQVGVAGVLIDAAVLGSTFALAVWLGTRGLGMDRPTALLIGAGASICGAAAVMAAQPVARARAEQVAVAVATVVVFGTLAMFLYPVLYRWSGQWAWLPSGEQAFGIYVGSTVHEVAQVVAAGRSVGEAAADTAVVTKMVRVMMLAPFLVLLSAWMVRTERRAGAGRPPENGPTQGRGQGWLGGIQVPWFALGFVAVVLFNSLQILPPAVVHALVQLDTALLAMAMAALGVSTHAGALRKAGLRPLLLAGLLFAWLVLGGALINLALPKLLAWVG